MRWSIVRLIFFRELRDQLRDRRTIFMIAVLPLVLYPVLGVAVLEFAQSFTEKPSVIGLVGSQYLPTGREDYPPLIVSGQVQPRYFEIPTEVNTLHVVLLDSSDRGPLEANKVDLILTVPSDFFKSLQEDRRPSLQISYRDKDEPSKLARKRLLPVLSRWKQHLREAKLVRRGLPADFNDLFEVQDTAKTKGMEELAAEGILDMLVRIFPFLLVMWSLAGALYPAVDLCAGEKERGTMETLLISPASRQEIVWGKFLTIWVFSAATALLNLASMGLTASYFSGLLTRHVLGPAAVFWCVLLALPLSAFFSALCLAMGAYARSSKEGQYYLMPLFLVTMPLIFLTLAPGVELNAFYSLVPVTGVALLMQRLMTVSLDQVPWLYFVPVLAPIVLYSGLALHWAIEQFKREEVLFREAERLEIGLWLRRLFREKEALPSAGQAFFCFALIMALRWAAQGWINLNFLVSGTAVYYLAFVAAPVFIIALMLTTKPRQGLALHWPSLRAILAAAALATLLLPPLAELTHTILDRFPHLRELINERQPLVRELGGPGSGTAWWLPLVVFGIMPAIIEELVFRGFILTGLRRRLRPWSAIVLSSFLFALYHMNVFQVLPAFIVGVVMGMLAVWSRSVFPGMLFHLIYNSLLLWVSLLPRLGYVGEDVPLQKLFHPVVTGILALLALALLAVLARRMPSTSLDGSSTEVPIIPDGRQFVN